MRKNKEIEMTLLPDKNHEVPICGVMMDAPSEASTSISSLSTATHFDDMDIQSLEIDVRKKQEFMATLFNLMSAMLGAGILAIPSTFVNTGLIISIILLIIIALLTFYATYIVISVARKTHAESFADLAEKTIGKAGKATLSALTLIFLISLEIAYILIAGDILMSWFKLGKIYVVDTLGYHALLIFVYAMLIPVALIIPKDVSFLKYFSGVNVAFIFFYVGVIVYKSIVSFMTTKKINPTIKYIKVGIEIFNSLSVYSLTFALPCIVLPILAPFNPNVQKRCIASALAMSIILVLALLSVVLCYLNLGETL